ncbi:MAG: nucleotidyltransferase family protein [Chloroflexi bacterium]|nr:nucleotidyltransferase family protein [Chloroflexota bacterium]
MPVNSERWIVDGERKLTQLIRAAFPFDDNAIEPPQVSADEWAAIAQSASAHRLTPLLYETMLGLDDALQPPGALAEKLETVYHQTKITNWAAFRELGELLAIFRRAKIPSVLLKGAALAKTLYPGIATRPMGDLDILIRREDAKRMHDILLARGFSTMLEPSENFYTRFSYDQAYERGGQNPQVIEAHWHLFSLPYYRKRIPIEWFWQRIMPIRVNDQPTHMFAPEAQIMHLAAHAVLHHQGHGLLALYDLALVLAHYREQIDWDDVIKAAHDFRLSGVLQSILGRTQKSWGVSIPDHVFERLAYSFGLSERILFAVNTAARVQARDVWDGMNLPDNQSRWLYLWHTLFPSRDYMQKRYDIADVRALPFHYVRRLGRGVGLFAQSVAAMVQNVVRVFGRKEIAKETK